MRPCLALAVLSLAGCGGAAPEPALRPGDTVRPQVMFTPDAPWPGGVKGGVGILIEVHRPGREGVSFLHEEDIPWQGVEMQDRITFLAGAAALGEPLEVPLERDC